MATILVLFAFLAPVGAFAGPRGRERVVSALSVSGLRHLPVSGQTAVTPEDAAATYAYVSAVYTFDRAILAALPAARTAVDALAASIGAECPGVFAGQASANPFGTLLGNERQSAKARGESRRKSRQVGDLEAELDGALTGTFSNALHQAAAALAGAVAPMQWSDATLTRLVHARANELVEVSDAAVPAACADIKHWAATGYDELSSGTKEFLAEKVRRDRSKAPGLQGRIHALLEPYEDPRVKALIRKVDRMTVREIELEVEPVDAIEEHVRRVVGIPASKIPQRLIKRVAALRRAAARMVVAGRGRTATGEEYEARVEMKTAKPSGSRGCRLRVSITGVRHIEIVNGGSGRCLSRSGAPARPSVSCAQPLLEIEALVPARTQAVELGLSNGRQITSAPIAIPARLGGPAGVYYQAVRGPWPVPVSLTELGPHGAVLGFVKLPRTVHCAAVEVLPGGVRTLARASAPSGPPFSIVGRHYRYLGRLHFKLRLNIEPTKQEEEAREEEDVDGISEGGGALVRGETHAHILAEQQVEPSCRPHEYAIVYALLKVPGDSVLARTSSGLVAMERATIPASLGAGGVLVYIALPEVPSELLVRTPSGETAFTESLTGLAAETREECEGEREP